MEIECILNLKVKGIKAVHQLMTYSIWRFTISFIIAIPILIDKLMMEFINMCYLIIEDR